MSPKHKIGHEYGARGSPQGHIRSQWSARSPGSFLNTSQVLLRQFSTHKWQKTVNCGWQAQKSSSRSIMHNDDVSNFSVAPHSTSQRTAGDPTMPNVLLSKCTFRTWATKLWHIKHAKYIYYQLLIDGIHSTMQKSVIQKLCAFVYSFGGRERERERSLPTNLPIRPPFGW